MELEKIGIKDLRDFLADVAIELPEIEPDDFDEYGEFSESDEFEVLFYYEGTEVAVYGTLRTCGYSIITPSVDRDVPPSHSFKQFYEIEDIDLFIEGNPVEDGTAEDLMKELNKVLN